MPGEEADAEGFEAEAPDLLESITKARSRLADYPGALSGELDRFRERIDRVIREAEVNNWRQVRIFMRDVDAVAADLAKAAEAKRLVPKHLAILDATLRKLRKRDFYGARKVWRKLDRFVGEVDEVRRLQSEYRERYRAIEARVRELRTSMDHLRRVPKADASPEDANAFVAGLEKFSRDAEASYLDFLARARADVSIPLLYETTQGRGVGIPGPPMGCDPEPLLRLLSNAAPGREEIRTRSFYGLLELPAYSDAKLTHLYGDSRIVRTALDAAWPWLKAIRDDERRSLQVLWSEDAGVLKRRVPSLVEFLERIRPDGEAITEGKSILADLMSGRFETLQRAARLHATYGKDAERKFTGVLEKDIQGMEKESARLSAVLKKFPEPAKVEAGGLD